MESPDASPERPVKITYKNRTKRKRELEDDNDARSVASIEASEVEGSPKRSPSKPKQLTEMGPPDSTKKLEFKVPEGPYKRQRRDSETLDNVSVGSSNKKTHIRSASSIASLKQLQPSSATSSPAQKPVSRTHKPSSSVSIKNPTPSESELDDGASIAESIISTTNRVRRTEGERIEYFKNQPEASNIEPHQVTCLRCKKTIQLGKKQTYAVKPWETHRTRCDAKVFQANEDNDNGSDTAATNTTARPRTTEAERKAILEREAAEVKIDEARCGRCDKWIRLGGGKTKYTLGNWQAHQSRCGGITPSGRVATAERKLSLVNDPMAKSFGPRHVECATCEKPIVLEGDADYTLTSWETHKSECHESDVPPSKTPLSPERRTVPRPPASVESSSTVVSPEGVEGSPPSRGVKRRLEEDVEDEQDGIERSTEPPTNRPRTETYVPPQQEAPSPLGWFMMPIRSFIRGFRESLS